MWQGNLNNLLLVCTQAFICSLHQASLHFHFAIFFHSVPRLHVTEHRDDGNHSNASPTCNDKKRLKNFLSVSVII